MKMKNKKQQSKQEKEYLKKVQMKFEQLIIKPRKYKLRFKEKFKLLKKQRTQKIYIMKKLFLQN